MSEDTELMALTPCRKWFTDVLATSSSPMVAPFLGAVRRFREKLTKLCIASGATTDIIAKELVSYDIDTLTSFYLMHGRFPSEITAGE